MTPRCSARCLLAAKQALQTRSEELVRLLDAVREHADSRSIR